MGAILYYDSWSGGLSGTFWLTGALFSGGVVLLTSTGYFWARSVCDPSIKPCYVASPGTSPDKDENIHFCLSL